MLCARGVMCYTKRVQNSTFHTWQGYAEVWSQLRVDSTSKNILTINIDVSRKPLNRPSKLWIAKVDASFMAIVLFATVIEEK